MVRGVVLIRTVASCMFFWILVFISWQDVPFLMERVKREEIKFNEFL